MDTAEATQDPPPVKVALFVTCLVDLFRPSVGFAAIKLLEQAGCRVEVPEAQTCCGQPAWNAGDRGDTVDIARMVIETFEPFDYVVVPSGSCAGMIRHHYPRVFQDDEVWRKRAEALSARTHELISFLVDIRGMERVDGVSLSRTATYHDGCSGLREMGVKEQPRRLLDSVQGLKRVDLPGAEVCCGFGGTFCIKYPEISNEMVTQKANDITGTGAQMVLAGDLGCLMNMAGKLRRDGSLVDVRHVAEVLAGMADDVPAIAAPAKQS